MAATNRKKKYYNVTKLNSDAVYALLDAVDSDHEEDIENIMNDSDTEFNADDTEFNADDTDAPGKELKRNDDGGCSSSALEAVVHPPAESDNIASTSESDTSSNISWKWSSAKKFKSAFQNTCRFSGKVLLNNVNENSTPTEVFGALIDINGMMDLIVQESERYACQKGRSFETSIPEMKAFLGMNFAMALNKQPSLKSYWSTDSGLGNPLIQNTMPRKNFLNILQNLHFANNLQNLPNSTDPQFDRAWKIQLILLHLNERFMKAIEPEEHQSVDEHMCKYKGRSIMRQYMKNKPIKWGFKFWFRSAAKSGYLHQFDIYTGRKQDTECGLSESVVLSLCEPLTNSFCHVYFDNFYTSPTLLKNYWIKEFMLPALLDLTGRTCLKIFLRTNPCSVETVPEYVRTASVP